MKKITIKLFLTFFLSFFIITFTTAQKIEVEQTSRTNSDFTTTPFQDGNQAKGMSIELDAFQMVSDGTFEEGNVEITIPTIFNPEEEAFSIHGNAVVLKMKVYNMLGELVYEGKMNASWQNINTPEGLYIYAIDTRILPNKTTKLKGYIRVEK